MYIGYIYIYVYVCNYIYCITCLYTNGHTAVEAAESSYSFYRYMQISRQAKTNFKGKVFHYIYIYL